MLVSLAIMLSLLGAGGVAASEAASPVPLPAVDALRSLVCTPGDDGVHIPVAGRVQYYDVPGRRPRQIERFLLHGDKPFSKRTNEVGLSEFLWQASVAGARGAEQQAQNVCIRLYYTIYLPRIEDPSLQPCFAGLLRDIQSHEYRHVEIVQQVVNNVASNVQGLPLDVAMSQIGRLDGMITAANDAFHYSPEGQPISVRMADRRQGGCRF